MSPFSNCSGYEEGSSVKRRVQVDHCVQLSFCLFLRTYMKVLIIIIIIIRYLFQECQPKVVLLKFKGSNTQIDYYINTPNSMLKEGLAHYML